MLGRAGGGGERGLTSGQTGRQVQDGHSSSLEALEALPVVACKLYRPDGGPQVVHDVIAALHQARVEGGFVWIGLHGASAADVHRLQPIFELPHLAVEDAVNAHQRPKFERYGEQSFVVLKPVRYVDHEEVVDVSEIALFLGQHSVISVRHGDSTVVADVRADVDLRAFATTGPSSQAEAAEVDVGTTTPTGAETGADVGLPASQMTSPAAVLYRLLDRVVDGYLDAVEGIAIDIEDIEERVFGGVDDEHAERIYKLKREVLEFKRAVVPLIVPVQRLVHGEAIIPAPSKAPHVRPPRGEDDTRSLTREQEADRPMVATEQVHTSSGRPYYRDVLDHLLRAADAIDGYDRLLTDVLQAHLAQISVRQSRVASRQNEDMRRISAWAAIALVPTAIAGIYGMNFDNMPELSTRYGYFIVLAVIVGICTTLYVVLKNKKWL